ncbi:hypothetical protein IQ269_25700 [Tychonema sp. LEGE 07199]|nr:hypothetical protein [Tychonema sp. LEGE 07196]MBE9124101.1 hypothetical protein [Tychonema sp. LEGE 07199]
MNFTSCDFYGKYSQNLTTSSSTASGNFQQSRSTAVCWCESEVTAI